MKKTNYFILVITFNLFLFSCSKSSSEENQKEDKITEKKGLSLNVSRLPNLGDSYTYEGWLIVDDKAKSIGRFDVNSGETTLKKSFEVDSNALQSATSFLITIEPDPDGDPRPSDSKILAGGFTGDNARLSVSNKAAIGDDFSGVGGKYLITTPTDQTTESNEKSGVWFLQKPDSKTIRSGLSGLPTLPEKGWKYEGWASIKSVPLSTGKFLSESKKDESNKYSNQNQAGPSFPGEDFLYRLPQDLQGVPQPINLSGANIFITLEPDPDNDIAKPFSLEILKALVPNDVIPNRLYTMSNSSSDSSPSGTASR